MILILYILVAAVVVFGMTLAHIQLDVKGSLGERNLWVPVTCGIFWPVAAPIYGAYLAARWYSERSEHDA